MKKLFTVINVMIATIGAGHSQTIERVVFSSVAGNNDNFQPIVGAPYGAHLSNANGSLTVAAEYGESTIMDGTLSIGSPNYRTERWRIYPCPTQDLLNIELPERAIVSLYTSSGQLIQTQQADGKHYSISLASYSPGHYLLHVEDYNGQRTFHVIKK
jgi:hypothetical protein